MKLRTLSLLAILLTTSACISKNLQEAIRPTDRPTARALSIALLASPGPQVESVLRGARMAAGSLKEKVLAEQLQINMSDASASVLAGLTDDPHVLGAITVGGATIISAAREVLSSSSFVVVEVRHDLYELSLLGPSVFQGTAPRSWQAFRLARYFGPGDRGYRKIGLAREPGPDGDSVARVLKDAADLRGLEVVDSPGDPQGAIANLRSHKPEAVVIEGSQDFISAATKILSSDPSSAYAGRQRIKDGWRPQIAGFSSLLAHEPVLGSVAGGDYARPAQSDGRIQRVEDFRKEFRDIYKREPSGDEIYGYEAVHLLAEAAKRSGAGARLDKAARIKLLEELERFDRVRFAQLPISLGPDDHVIAERDVLGLYCFEGGRWLHLMRTFTSDLERTNLLEEDWASYFDGAVPGGEAPFFHQAKGGVTTDRSDDLR